MVLRKSREVGVRLICKRAVDEDLLGCLTSDFRELASQPYVTAKDYDTTPNHQMALGSLYLWLN